MLAGLLEPELLALQQQLEQKAEAQERHPRPDGSLATYRLPGVRRRQNQDLEPLQSHPVKEADEY